MANTTKQTTDAIKDMILGEATRQGLDPQFVFRLVNQESGFNPNARSKAGAIGLFQLMPGTAQGLGVNPYDFHLYIQVGVK